jgi:hypothetical protein
MSSIIPVSVIPRSTNSYIRQLDHEIMKINDAISKLERAVLISDKNKRETLYILEACKEGLLSKRAEY